jgi:hypothetical protein
VVSTENFGESCLEAIKEEIAREMNGYTIRLEFEKAIRGNRKHEATNLNGGHLKKHVKL